MPLFKQMSNSPKGVTALFFIQLFSTLGFAVLYSTLVLYATKHLHFSTELATQTMGVFGAFNYGLHLFGGYLGGRFLSNRNLFVGGMVLQVIGCALISLGTAAMLYLGLALFLTGSGLNVTCINMMLTQRFEPQDNRREGAFLWNYAAMNIGFFIGFSAAGYFQETESYSSLFIFATLGNLFAMILAAFNWRTLRDINTPLLTTDKTVFKQRLVTGIAILVGLVPIVWYLLQTTWVALFIKILCLILLFYFIYLTLIHPNPAEKNKMWAYLIFAFSSLVFWSLYQMAPSGLQLFAVNNVKLIIGGITIAPQWVQNINTISIVIGGPLLSAWFAHLRTKGWKIEVHKQFALSLLIMGAGFLALPVGIHFADAQGLVPFFWLFLSYVLQSIGELLISPIGYAMIGRIAPQKYQGSMMGGWMLVTGLASLFSGDFSGMVPEPTEGAALSTNAAYSHLFSALGWGTVAVGVILVVLIPFVGRLIQDEIAPKKETQ